MMNLKYKNIIFDCDSTLTKIEGLDFIAEKKGMLKEVRDITARGMNGAMLFSESLKQRLNILQLTYDDLKTISAAYTQNIVEDVIWTVRILENFGAKVFVLTGALQPPVLDFARFIKLDPRNIVAVPVSKRISDVIEIEADIITELDTMKIREVFRIRLTGRTVLIGDGVTDLEAGKMADLFIGFGGVVARESVRRNSSYYIEECKLSKVLDFVL